MKLEDACTVFVDGDWIESKDQSNSGIRLIQTGNIGNGEYLEKEDKAKYVSEDTFDTLKCSEVFPGDILISRLPDPVGRACIIPNKEERMITAVDCTICRPNEDKVLKEYLCYFMQSDAYYNQLVNSITGATRKRISRKNLGKIEIHIPNKNIQKKVITNLDLVTKIIRLKREELSTYNDLVKSRFVELVEANKSTAVKMGDIATYINGYAFKPTDWSTEGLPIIRIQNLNDSNAIYNHYLGNLKEKYLVHNGDVLISWATHLEAYIWQGNDAWLNQHIFKVEFDKKEVDKYFFIHAANEALRYAFRNAHGFKPTMEHLKRGDFEDATTYLPSIDIQKEFGLLVHQVDKSKLSIQQSIETLQTLKAKLMQDYFG